MTDVNRPRQPASGSRLNRAALCGMACLLMAAHPTARAQEGNEAINAYPSHTRSVLGEAAMKVSGPFTVAVVGDIIEPAPIDGADPRSQQLVQLIRHADVGFANMESSLVNFSTFKGRIGGTEAPLDVGRAIKAMGIAIMSRANNHTLDGGVPGMLSTDRELDELGIVHAGTGVNLQAARAARYVETSKGAVGLVSMYAEEGASKADASLRNGNLGGAPGLDALHLTSYQIVTPEQLRTLKAIATANYGGRPESGASGPDRYRFYDGWYETGAHPGTVHYEMDPEDLKGILRSIRNGKVYSDFMIAAVHAHEAAHFVAEGRGGVDHAVPDFLVKLAHDSIDNGADIFVVHGMHCLRGVEIYKGKPIFYDVGAFVFQFGRQFGDSDDIIANERRMSTDENPASQVGLLALSHFDHGKLAWVRLYPVDLGGARRPLSKMGIPLTPPPEEADRILKTVQEYSQPFGTKIEIENGVGVINSD